MKRRCCQRNDTRSLNVHSSLTNRTNARRRAATCIVKPRQTARALRSVTKLQQQQAMMQDGWSTQCDCVTARQAPVSHPPMPCSPVQSCSECPPHCMQLQISLYSAQVFVRRPLPRCRPRCAVHWRVCTSGTTPRERCCWFHWVPLPSAAGYCRRLITLTWCVGLLF